jgi:hypothetical protein
MTTVTRDALERLARADYRPAVLLTRTDMMLALLAAVLAAVLSLEASASFAPAFYQTGSRPNRIWFEADHTAVLVAIIVPRSVAQTRTNRHPLFLLLMAPMVRALTAGGLDPASAVRWMLASWAALASGLLFLALRGLGLPRAAGGLFTAVFLASATFVHWFAVLDTHPMAAVTMSLMLLILTGARSHRLWLWAAGSAATLAITFTNWSLGLVASLARLGFRRAAVTAASALAIVTVLALAQEFWFPVSAVFFRPRALQAQGTFALLETQHAIGADDGPDRFSPVTMAGARLRGLLLTSAVAPAPQLEFGTNPRRQRILVTNQYSPPGAYSANGWIALASWLVLVVAGVAGGCVNAERRRVFTAVCLFVVGQIVLHLLIGEVTFLYAPNVFGALVVLTAFSWFSPLRRPAIVAAVLFVVSGGWSNHAQFDAAVRLLGLLGQAG